MRAYFAPGELIYEVKREKLATAAQKRYLNDLIKYHKIAIDYAVDQLTKNEASRKIDQILLTTGGSGSISRQGGGSCSAGCLKKKVNR